MFKKHVNFTLGDDFTSTLIKIQGDFNCTHPQMMALRQRLLLVYKNKNATYDRRRKEWRLIAESQQVEPIITLDQLARGARALMDAGTTVEQVCALTDAAILEAAK